MKIAKRHHRTIRAAMAKRKDCVFEISVTAGVFDWSWTGPSRLWLFPDGSTSTDERPTRTLTEAGIVKLKVNRIQDWTGDSVLSINSSYYTFVGDLSDLPPLTYGLSLTNCTNVTGDLADLPRLSYWLDIPSCAKLTGDLADLPPVCYWMHAGHNNNHTGAVPVTMMATNIWLKSLPNIDIDQCLINLDTAGQENGTLDATGTTPAVTAVSATARANLIAKGWTLTINT